MTRDYFKAYKAQTLLIMEAYLEHSKVVGYPLKDYCTGKEQQIVTIDREADTKTIADAQAEIAKLLLLPDTVVRIRGNTEQRGRYDVFTSVDYIFNTQTIRERLNGYDLEYIMKRYVKEQIGIKLWDDLDCKTMQLFKDGDIEWDTVVKSHGKDCSI